MPEAKVGTEPEDRRPGRVEEVWIAVGLSKVAGRWFAAVAFVMGAAGVAGVWVVAERLRQLVVAMEAR